MEGQIEKATTGEANVSLQGNTDDVNKDTDQKEMSQPEDDMDYFKTILGFYTILRNEVIAYRTLFFSALVLSFSIPLAVSSKKIEFCYVAPSFTLLLTLIFIFWVVGVIFFVIGIMKGLLYAENAREKANKMKEINLALFSRNYVELIPPIAILIDRDITTLTRSDFTRRCFIFAILSFFVSVGLWFSMYVYTSGGLNFHGIC
jgi:hypothetical protein